MTALRDIKVPYILTCMVTGLVKSYTSKEFVQRKIDNYGGDESAMKLGFVCKDAKREIKGLGDITKVTEDDIAKMIKKLGGTESAKTALDRIQGGKLFLTKKVKVRTVKQGAAAAKSKSSKKATSGAKKQGSTKGKSAAKKSSKKTQGAKSDTTAATEPATQGATKQGSKQGEKITTAPVVTTDAAAPAAS